MDLFEDHVSVTPGYMFCDNDDEMSEDERREQDEAIEVYNNPDADSDD